MNTSRVKNAVMLNLFILFVKLICHQNDIISITGDMFSFMFINGCVSALWPFLIVLEEVIMVNG